MSPFDVTSLRAALALNPLQLAEHLGVPARLVLQWEAGDRFPTKKHCEMMRELRRGAGQSSSEARALPPQNSGEVSVTEVVRRLLADPTFARRLHELVADYLNSSSGSEAPTSLQSSSGAAETDGSNSFS